MDDLKFAHHGLREKECAVLPATLPALKRIVEVAAIHRFFYRSGTLSCDHQPAGICVRHNSGGKLAKLAEIPVAIGHVGNSQSGNGIAGGWIISIISWNCGVALH